MNWLLDHFQIVVIISLGLASFAKSRLDARRAQEEEQQAREEMANNGPAEEWPPQVQTAPSVPPPLVRQPPPLMREATPQHSREYEADVILKRQNEMQDRLRQIKESKTNTSGGASATRTRVAASQTKTEAPHAAKTGLRGTLRKRKEIRRAMILREILGPPVGLR